MQLVFNALIAGSLAALIAGGLALVYGVLGIFNMALGQLVLVGGYVTWWLHQVLLLPLSISILGGLLVGTLFTWLTFEIFVNPFYKHHRFLPIVTTIALSMILDSLILLIFEERPRSIMPGLKDTFLLLGAHVSWVHIILVVGTFALLALFAYVFHSTMYGRRLRAVVQHPHAAMSLGVPAVVLHKSLFLISGFFAACAGIFIGMDQSLSPVLAFSLTIKAYAAVIAGGKGNFWGAIFCAYFIALLEQLVVGVHWFGKFYVPAGYQASIALLFIIVFLVYKPEGLFARSSRSA